MTEPVADGLAWRTWRVLGTGFSFAAFGLTALLLSITVFPLIALVTPDRSLRSRRVQRVLHHGCRASIAVMEGFGLISHEAHGLERLRQPGGAMIVANHPSLIDVVFLLSWLPQADCIMKQALQGNPFLRFTVGWAGYIGNAAPDGLIRDCADTLARGRVLIVFPEGTRSVPGRPAIFRRGAARIALASGAAMVPVRIGCEPVTLTKNNPWWRVPPRTAHYVFRVGEPFRAKDVVEMADSAAVAARHLTANLQSLLVPSLPDSVPVDVTAHKQARA